MQCAELEQRHDERMEQYISLVELQSRYFRKGYARTGKDLDGPIRLAKAERERAMDELLDHSAAAHPVGPTVSAAAEEG